VKSDRVYPLVNGILLPVLGFGTYKINSGNETCVAVKQALGAGYRSFDTASFYGNEQSIGQAIKQYGISREEVFLASKVWNDQQGYANTVRAFEESLAALGTDYLDLYLVHWPVEKTMRSTWRALEHLYIAGRVRAIGVCNHEIAHLERLLKSATITPMVNQIELHPWFTRDELVSYCWRNGMLVQSWAPLMRGGVTTIPELTEVGKRYGKTEAQVALRWAIQHNFAVIPKSITPSRIAENMQVFDFKLTVEEMAIIDSLNQGLRLGPDPEEFSWRLA
jgi:diketogulonate reductase-like aldo/keto reductase